MALPAESRGRLIEEVPLIDILYKDEYRIDSYLAQMMNGVLRRRKLQETESQTDEKTISSSIKIVSGSFNDIGVSSLMEETRFVPHDRNVITLLETLDLEPQENLSSENVSGRLVCLKGRLAIRDFGKFNEIISAMANNSKAFNVNQKEAKELKKTFDSLSKIIPMNIEAEFVFKDNSVVRGILKEKYLLTDYRDVVATHGTNLPGIWFMVGILDSLLKPSRPTQPQGFRKSMDEFSAVAETLYREGNPRYTVTPFLIFRGLEK